MVLHQKYFRATEIDLKAAKILAKENFFPPTLYHLQQAYEKGIESYYIFRIICQTTNFFYIIKFISLVYCYS